MLGDAHGPQNRQALAATDDGQQLLECLHGKAGHDAGMLHGEGLESGLPAGKAFCVMLDEVMINQVLFHQGAADGVDPIDIAARMRTQVQIGALCHLVA